MVHAGCVYLPGERRRDAGNMTPGYSDRCSAGEGQRKHKLHVLLNGKCVFGGEDLLLLMSGGGDIT